MTSWGRPRAGLSVCVGTAASHGMPASPACHQLALTLVRLLPLRLVHPLPDVGLDDGLGGIHAGQRVPVGLAQVHAVAGAGAGEGGHSWVQGLEHGAGAPGADAASGELQGIDQGKDMAGCGEQGRATNEKGGALLLGRESWRWWASGFRALLSSIMHAAAVASKPVPTHDDVADVFVVPLIEL